MKKRILLFTVAVMTVMSVNAGGNLKFVGSYSAKNIEKGANAFVEFNFDTATWEELQDFKRYCDNTNEERVIAMSRVFITTFNKECKKIKIVRDSTQTSCKYKIVFAPNDFEQKMSGWGRFNIRWRGSITIIDLTNNAIICRLSGEVKSKNDYVQLDRLVDCYRELAKKMAALIGK